MAIEIKPLNALVYNQDKVEIKDVIAPPYDVISEKYRDELYKRSPYNITRLILSNAEDPYKDASETFRKWLDEKVLIKTDKPVIFYLLQKYKLNGKEITRKGFIARNKIEDFSTGNILPHEFTMSGPKEDRLKLTKACKANFSQIFMVYSDPEKQIEKAVDLSGTPYIDVTDDNGVRNTVWKIEDEKTIALIEKVLKDKTLLIADGHHRYETALKYRDDMRAEEGLTEGEERNYDYVMMMFVNFMDEGLKVFPTHRVIDVAEDYDDKAFLDYAASLFEITPLADQPAADAYLKEHIDNAGAWVYYGKQGIYGMNLSGLCALFA